MKKKRYLLFIASIIGTYLGAEPTTTLLSVISVVDASQRLYMPEKFYKTFLERGGQEIFISRKRVKSVSSQYEAMECLDVSMKKIQEKIENLESFTLIDGAYCLIPSDYFLQLGLKRSIGNDDFPADRLSARSFMHIMIEVYDALVQKDDGQKEHYLKSYFYMTSRPQDKRRFQRFIYAYGKVPLWLKRVFASGGVECDDDASSMSSTSSSCSSVRSSSSFSDDTDSRESHKGEKKITLLSIARESGGEPLRKRYLNNDGTILDFSDLKLVSIDDLGKILRASFSHEELQRITKLDLSSNQIFSLSDRVFSCLPNLKDIDLSHNPLETINAHAFLGIICLEKLFISHASRLVSLPDSFSEVASRLKSLTIEDCENLSDCGIVARLLNLEYLSLAHNKLNAMPNASALQNLKTLNLIDNNITKIESSFLPRNAKTRKFSLALLQLDGNKIASIPSHFYDGLPDEGMCVSLCSTCKQSKNTLEHELFHVGFERIAVASMEKGVIVAHEIGDSIFDDTADKFCRYLGAYNSMIPSVVRDEIRHKRSFDNIFIEEQARINERLFLEGGTILITTLAGGLLGYFIKTQTSAVKRVALGAAAGLGVGSALAYGIYKECEKRSYQGPYLNNGIGPVIMSDELKRIYTGVFRQVALLSLLKQYLVAVSTLLNWVVNYDDYADNPKRIDILMCHLERDMHLEKKKLFARIDDATTIALLHELISENPMSEIKRHVSVDLFNSEYIERADLACDAIFRGVDLKKIEKVRGAISVFGTIARMLRAILVNRYIGTYDHEKTMHIVCKASDLSDLLVFIESDIVAPLILEMGRLGETADAWYQEMLNLKEIVKKVKESINKFVEHREAPAKTIFK